MSDRNPIIFVDQPSKKPACPYCGHEDFNGRRINGAITFTCAKRECRKKWYGGLPQIPEDPMNPLPPDTDKPSVEQMAIKDKDGRIVDTFELRRPTSQSQQYRGGSPIKNGEEP